MNKTTEQFESILNQNHLELNDRELDVAIDTLLDYLEIDVQNKEAREGDWHYIQGVNTQNTDNTRDASAEGLLSML